MDVVMKLLQIISFNPSPTQRKRQKKNKERKEPTTQELIILIAVGNET